MFQQININLVLYSYLHTYSVLYNFNFGVNANFFNCSYLPDMHWPNWASSDKLIEILIRLTSIIKEDRVLELEFTLTYYLLMADRYRWAKKTKHEYLYI